MVKKLITSLLVIFIVIIFGFISTYSWFLAVKERVCAVNLNTPACGEHYQSFLAHKLGR